MPGRTQARLADSEVGVKARGGMGDTEMRGSAWSLFANRDFTLLLAARFCSMSAQQILSVAVSWQVYVLTGRALDLGLIGLVQFLPAFLLMPLTGEVADRVDRRRVISICSAVGAAAAAVLFAAVAAESHSLWLYYGAMLVFATSRSFAFTAQQALTPMLVARDDLGRAIAWASSVNNIAMIGAPALGGLLLSVRDSAGYLVALVLLAIATVAALSIRTRTGPAERRAVSFSEVFAGVRFVAERPAILGAISIDLFAVLMGDVTALLPIYAKDILGVGAPGLGLLRSAPSLGAVMAALALAQWPLGRLSGRIMLASLVGYGALTVLFALSHVFFLSCAALVALGSADMMSVFVRTTLVQTATPDRMRGRVSAVNAVFINSSNQLGQLESGVAAACFGPVSAAVIGGVGAILVALIWQRVFPVLARIDLSPAGLKQLADAADASPPR